MQAHSKRRSANPSAPFDSLNLNDFPCDEHSRIGCFYKERGSQICVHDSDSSEFVGTCAQLQGMFFESLIHLESARISDYLSGAKRPKLRGLEGFLGFRLE